MREKGRKVIPLITVIIITLLSDHRINIYVRTRSMSGQANKIFLAQQIKCF